jgi:hypothetical protein
VSLRNEQYRALQRTKAFLWELLDPQKRPKTVAEMRHNVRACTKHFPPLDEHGKPHFSRDPFGPDEPPEK